MKVIAFISIPILILIYLIMRTFSKKDKLSFSDGYEKTRDCDPLGCGHFHAPRGNRLHKGLDFLKDEHDVIRAPFDCVVDRIGFPYSDDTSYRLMVLKSMDDKYKGFELKVMYVSPTVSENSIQNKGYPIATAQDISSRYDIGMLNHIHVELRINGVLTDPKNYFKI